MFGLYLIFIGIVSVSFNDAFFQDCVEPPITCPNPNVTFWLYTRANSENPHQISVTDPDSIDSAPWVPDAPIKVIIHGYTGHKDYAPSKQLRPAYLQCCNYNLISIDYNPLVREPCYPQAARNTQIAGKCLAQLVDEMVTNHNFSLSRFHIIGFSLGAHVAGFTGQYVTVGKFDRVTGLDPALPLFVTMNENKKLDKTDGRFVDVLHTNALEKGKLEASGDVDFFANGGITQPGCRNTENQTRSGCDHERAPIYYAESIISDVGFYGKNCSSWIFYLFKWCANEEKNEILFGEYVSHDATGLYFFSTNSESPHAKGHS